MTFDWKALVKSIAPTIGTALGGPLGGVAGLALSKALGMDDAAAKDDTALAAAVQGASPDQLLTMKKADQDFAIQMQKLGFENMEAIEAIAAGDRDSARKREMEVKDRTPSIGFYLLTTGFYGLLAFFAWSAMRPEIRPNAEIMDILKIMVGSLGAAWLGAVNYYYGSTSGSRGKDQLLYRSVPSEKA
jgi:hypothetical protein